MGRSASSKNVGAQFAILEPRIHRVTAAAVKKKWKKLSPSSQQNVQDIINSIKRQSGNNAIRSKGPTNDSDSAVNEVATRLCERLPRMPFPSTATEETFDFELTLNHIQNIEHQLTNNVHSINLLREQIKNEESSLRTDKEEVLQLQESLKANNTLRKQQQKTLHPLARTLNNDNSKSRSSLLKLGNVIGCNTNTTLFDLSEDPEVAALLQKLGDHLESMGSNIAGMQTVLEHVHNANCALDISPLENFELTVQ